MDYVPTIPCPTCTSDVPQDEMVYNEDGVTLICKPCARRPMTGVFVERPIGTTEYTRADVRPMGEGEFKVISRDTGNEMAHFLPGYWRKAFCYNIETRDVVNYLSYNGPLVGLPIIRERRKA